MKFLSQFIRALLAQMLAFISLFFILFFLGMFFVFFFISQASADFSEEMGEISNYQLSDKDHILEIDLSNIVEAPTNSESREIERFFSNLSGEDYSPGISLYNLTSLLKKAAKDDKIIAVSLDLSQGTNMGLSQISEFNRSLDLFKKSGKKVYSHAEEYSQRAYLAASAADSIFMHPMGVVGLKGFGIVSLYFKKLLTNMGISIDVWKMGKYKSAVEFLSEEKPSPASMKALQELLDDLWASFTPQLMQKSLKTKEELKNIVENRNAFLPQKALELGVINGLCDKSEYMEKFSKNYDRVDALDYLLTMELDQDHDDEQKSIALVYLNGSIIDNSDDVHSSINRNTLDILKDIEEDDDLSSVVLRINSPGGSALMSDRIWKQLERIKKDKTVIVSFSNVAASGGYYIACGADRIFTESQTITGSIGVIGLMISAEETLHGIGVYNATIQTHKNAIGTEGGLFKRISRYTYEQIDELLKDVYDKFLNRVAQGRGLDVNYVHKIGQGRVWSGKRAVDLKLADEIGGLDKALAFAAQKEGLTNYEVVEYPKKDVFNSLKSAFLSTGIQTFPLLKTGLKVSREFSQLGIDLDDLSKLSVQARMPYFQVR